MIRLCIEKYCENCKDFEPEITKSGHFFNSKGYVHHTNIYCGHRDRCENIMGFLSKECDKKEKENG